MDGEGVINTVEAAAAVIVLLTSFSPSSFLLFPPHHHRNQISKASNEGRKDKEENLRWS